VLPVFQLGELGLGLHQGLGNNRWYLIVYVAQPFGAFVLASLASVLGTRQDTASLEWGAALIALPFSLRAAAVGASSLRLPQSDSSPAISDLLAYTARFYPTTLAQFLSFRLDLVMVSGLLGSVAAGTYSLALNGVDAVARVGYTAGTVLYPRFSRSEASEASAKLACRAAIAVGLLSFGLVFALSAVVLVVGNGRSEEILMIGLLLAVVAPGGGAVSAWTVLGSFLAAQGRLRATGRVSGTRPRRRSTSSASVSGSR